MESWETETKGTLGKVNYLMKRSQDFFARVRLEVLVHNVGDHEPGRPGLIGHGRRRRRRDAAQNFLRGPVIHFLSGGL